MGSAATLIPSVLDSPIGPLTIWCTQDDRLARIDFGVATTSALMSEEVSRSSDVPCALIQLREYFTGQRQSFSVRLVPQSVSSFASRVLSEMSRIPYGATLTYGELATRVGAPGAARAVGTVCAKNAIPLVIPCHRVVRSVGGWGSYAGGVSVKRMLLDFESKTPLLT